MASLEVAALAWAPVPGQSVLARTHGGAGKKLLNGVGYPGEFWV